jgi:Fe-S-cluster containining protein
LSGLQLAEEEFYQHFKSHAAVLDVVWSNKSVVVSVRQGGPCPHWTENGCSIYLSRPVDCRVFPYVITQIIEQRNKVKITFHNRSDCPKKDRLYQLMPEADIRALLIKLGHKAYGEGREVMVRHADEITGRLRNRIKSALKKQWSRIRN